MPGWFPECKPPAPKVPFAFIYIADLHTFELPLDRLPVSSGTTLKAYHDVDDGQPITYVAAFREINQFAEAAHNGEFGDAIALWWEQCARHMEKWLVQK
jgi:hypothetical protein